MSLKNKRFFLLDMDGTIYLDNDLFDGTLDFLSAVKASGGKYLFVTNNSSKSTDDYVQKLADTVHVKGCTCTVSHKGYRVMMEDCARNRELLDKVNRIFEQTGLPTLRAGKRTGGSDAADVTVFGIPCLDSLGVTGGKLHSKEEFANLDSLRSSAKRLAAVASMI